MRPTAPCPCPAPAAPGLDPPARRRRGAALCAIVGALALGVPLALSAAPARAGTADVVGVEAVQDDHGTWRFEVTVRHDDAGWDHYADRWEIVAPDGTVLGVRELAHPHVAEQPFTRSLGGVDVPTEIDRVMIRARDSVHGYGGAEFPLRLPGR